MSLAPVDDEADLNELKRRWYDTEKPDDQPRWLIWRSVRSDGTLGDWCATRGKDSAGPEPTVIRNTALQLDAALIEQAMLADAGVKQMPPALTL